MAIIYFVLVTASIIGGIKLFRYIQKRRQLKTIREYWGEIFQNKFGKDIALIFWNKKKGEPGTEQNSIDDAAWKDLNMDELFMLMNRSLTPAGAQYLYYLLHHPLKDKTEIEKRYNLIDLFLNDTALREKVMLILSEISNPYASYLPEALYKDLPRRPKYAIVFNILSYAAVISVLLASFKVIHIGFIIPIFMINMAVRSIWKKKIFSSALSFQYLAPLITVCERLSEVKHDGLENLRSEVEVCVQPVRKLKSSLLSFQFSDDVGPAVLIKTLFLVDITGYYNAEFGIRRNIRELKRLFEIAGYYDALISAASFLKTSSTYCRPVFTNDSDSFEVKGIYHPLLVDPVKNDFTFSRRNVMITGSNMAGKTTFIKTIGVNTLLAQVFGFCTADLYKAGMLRLITSIEREDDLLSGKSYYMAEVESILKIVRASEDSAPCLILIDEIFRGTNSIERNAASCEVLKYIANGKDFVVSATHDLNLSEELSGIYQNYHFREEMDSDGLHFDYKIYDGITKSRNAIALLEYAGYPEEIVKNARIKISD